jgi:hypothetical protein
MRCCVFVPLLTIVGWAMCGCGRPEVGTASPMPEGSRYLLAAEPAAAVSVVEAKQVIAASTARVAAADTQPEQGNETADVAEPFEDWVIVGRIPAGSDETWDATRAAFIVRDLSLTTDGAHHHEGDAHDDCPFCKANAKKALEMSALVQVVDDNGAVVPVDARKLLGLRENEVVVVRGAAHMDTLGNLVISARGVFVRR